MLHEASGSVLPPIPEYRNWKMAKTAARAYSKLTCVEAPAPGDDGQEVAPRSPSTDSHSDSDADVGTSHALARGCKRDAKRARLDSELDGSVQCQQNTPPTSTRASSKRACPATPPGRERRPCPAQTKFFKAGAAPPPHLLAAAERARSPTN
eukprot:scaffold37921_cov75-Phaeocystis_antarctica.AAC.4